MRPNHSNEFRTLAPSTSTIVSTVWWLNPALLFVSIAMGTLIPAIALPDSAYSSYGTPKHLNLQSIGLGLLACVMMASGVGIGMSAGSTPQRVSRATLQALVPWFYVATGLTLFGYGAWVLSAIARGLRPGHVVQLLSGGDHEAFMELKFDIFQRSLGSLPAPNSVWLRCYWAAFCFVETRPICDS